MSDTIAGLLYEGARAVREGRREQGRDLLMQVIERDEQNEAAWLWLSGAVDDPADQQVALENVLAINPHNLAAQEGLEWLKQQQRSAQQVYAPAEETVTGSGEWTPPEPWDDNEVVELSCWKCNATLYSVAPFCWQCHAAVRCCNNCFFRNVSRCKELQGLTNSLAQAAKNDCPWWRPAV